MIKNTINDFKVSVLSYNFEFALQEEYKKSQDKLDKICEILSEETPRILKYLLDLNANEDYD